jgi:DNA polymerase I-like protein with 3'-5' exonuclease and polymerase domains
MIDQDQLKWRVDWLETEKKKSYEKAKGIPVVAEFTTEHEAAKKHAKFSLRSSPQMQRVLFDLLDVKPSSILTEKNAPSLSAAAIEEMLLNTPEDSDGAKFLHIIHRANKVSTTLTNGIGPLIKNMWPDGKLHADFGRRAESSRRRTSKPNVQNLSDGRGNDWEGDAENNPWNLRMLIQARPGHTFIYPDFDQLEWRLAACYSKDPNMIAVCQPKPNDAHTLAAIENGIDRFTAKIFNFGLIYDASAKRLRSEIFEETGQVWPLDKCEKVRAWFRTRYKDLFLLKASYDDFMKHHGYIITAVFGHKRLLPKAMIGDEKALREGWNHLMQGSGHCLLDMAMLELYYHIKDQAKPWFLANDKHDGFLLEVPTDQVQEAATICNTIMREVPKKALGDWMIVPIQGSITIGTHFGNLKEFKDLAPG